MNRYLARVRHHSALPVAALIGLAACGDDTPSDTPDTSASDTAEDGAGDSTAPSDADDTTVPLDTASDAAEDSMEDAAADVMADTAEDTAEDMTSDDIVTPATASAVLVAWEGFNPDGLQRGTIQVSVSTGSAFGAFEGWKSGTGIAPVLFGGTANLLGDVDGDGKGDLLAWTGLDPNGPQRGTIQVSLSAGDAFADFSSWKAGTDQAPVLFGSTANLLGDVDGDGKGDLVAWNGLNPNGPQRGSVQVSLSGGTAFGDFTAWKSGTDAAPVLFGATASLLGDVDGDGRADLVAWSGLNPAGPQRGTVQVSLSTGAAFSDFTTWKAGTNEGPVVFGSTANLLADVDGDGRADLVAWNGRSTNSPSFGSISVMLSTGSAFANPTTWLAGTVEAPVFFGSTANLVADVNGDGMDDLIAWEGRSTNSPSFGGIHVFLSTGTGFAPPALWFSGSVERPTLFGSTANLAGVVAD